jgi:hypothetical protein
VDPARRNREAFIGSDRARRLSVDLEQSLTSAWLCRSAGVPGWITAMPMLSSFDGSEASGILSSSFQTMP